MLAPFCFWKLHAITEKNCVTSSGTRLKYANVPRRLSLLYFAVILLSLELRLASSLRLISSPLCCVMNGFVSYGGETAIPAHYLPRIPPRFVCEWAKICMRQRFSELLLNTQSNPLNSIVVLWWEQSLTQGTSFSSHAVSSEFEYEWIHQSLLLLRPQTAIRR